MMGHLSIFSSTVLYIYPYFSLGAALWVFNLQVGAYSAHFRFHFKSRCSFGGKLELQGILKLNFGDASNDASVWALIIRPQQRGFGLINFKSVPIRR